MVKTPTGKTIPIQVTENLTVKDFKPRIQNQEGIPPDQQRLIVTGVEMEDDWTLKDYGLQPDAIVHLVFQSLVKAPL